MVQAGFGKGGSDVEMRSGSSGDGTKVRWDNLRLSRSWRRGEREEEWGGAVGGESFQMSLTPPWLPAASLPLKI